MRSNQSILKEISPECSLRTDAKAEAPILWSPDVKSWLIGKDPDAGKDWRQGGEGGGRGWDGWMASLTQWTWIWATSGRWWRTGKPGVLQSMGLQRLANNKFLIILATLVTTAMDRKKCRTFPSHRVSYSIVLLIYFHSTIYLSQHLSQESIYVYFCYFWR